MPIELSPLPFGYDELSPFMSPETLRSHYDHHHAGYVRKLNDLISGTRFDSMSLEEIILASAGSHHSKSIFNNAAQAWNHGFFWQCLSPQKQQPSFPLTQLINKSFGSTQKFIDGFTQAAIDHFGSGWVWLEKNENGSLSIMALENAGTPITLGKSPLLVCDVWEHAYYLDYKSDRKAYVKGFLSLINWQFVEQCYAETSAMPTPLRAVEP